MKYHSVITKNEIIQFAASYIDGPRDHTKQSKLERQCLYDITYLWDLKKMI